jgi:hypothetical protein
VQDTNFAIYTDMSSEYLSNAPFILFIVAWHLVMFVSCIAIVG